MVIAGFGLPGRAIAALLDERGISYTVIEVNAQVVDRCTRTGLHILCGDARDPDLLRRAGIEHAHTLAVVIPIEQVVLECIDVAKSLNSKIRILARAAFTSAGMEMTRRGAASVIVAEQVIACYAETEIQKLLNT